MPSRKRPLSPWVVALFTFFFVPLGGSIIFYLLWSKEWIRFVRGVEGLWKLSFFLAIGAYFVARTRTKDWEERELKAQRLENLEQNAGRVRCKRCGIVITGSDQPWQQELYCSEKCKSLHARSS